MPRRSTFEDISLTCALDLQSQEGFWTPIGLLSLTSCRLDTIVRDDPTDHLTLQVFTQQIVDRGHERWQRDGWAQPLPRHGSSAGESYEFTDRGLAIALKAAGRELSKEKAGSRMFIFNMFPRIPQVLIDRALAVPGEWNDAPRVSSNAQ
jgi:hypothetical protein